MSETWQTILEIRFTPAEAELITRVSTSLQRKWTQLHFGSDSEANPHLDMSAGGHRRYTFSGVQRLAFFRDVSRDLGTRYVGGEVAKSGQNATAHFSAAMTMLTHSDLFGVDLRNHNRGDLFIYRSLVDGASDQFATATVGGIGRLLVSEWGTRLYIYNVSAMQRELAARVESLQFNNQLGRDTIKKRLATDR